MEENKEVLKSKNKELGEDQLEEVAGGGTVDNCWFEPEQPIKYSKANGAVYVKCKSRCSDFHNWCSCHNTMYCVDRWHMAEQDGAKKDKWYPLPRNMYNHIDSRKVIEPLNVT